MPLWEADAKFPGQQGKGLPPEQTPENPGQVYPNSSPSRAQGLFTYESIASKWHIAASQAEHWDRPHPPGVNDSNTSPAQTRRPDLVKSTDAVPGNGHPRGGDDPSSFASKDQREEEDNPCIDSKIGMLFAD
ncbi:hypothetical protein DACRYDRAFT_105829 [Dacryopinax primogenitus]|uniref:Uncharacterized protein n=1 Tax=Dacryopinax primogenitus (strain DJM 731) TaxID=1858805 RepID=M5GC49_DACPD|nr:uncharacterized protein DACRYDRAFT_105829 [Dacryopinax primogenitus]EJU03667.1 hypothetical protein DACRYDRAFT_105829 [Dacryopinax primogenitus]